MLPKNPSANQCNPEGSEVGFVIRRGTSNWEESVPSLFFFSPLITGVKPPVHCVFWDVQCSPQHGDRTLLHQRMQVPRRKQSGLRFFLVLHKGCWNLNNYHGDPSEPGGHLEPVFKYNFRDENERFQGKFIYWMLLGVDNFGLILPPLAQRGWRIVWVGRRPQRSPRTSLKW